MPRRRIDHVSPVDLGWASAEVIEDCLRTLQRNEVTVIYAVICAGVPLPTVAQELGITTKEVRRTCSRAMSKLRFHGRSIRLRDYFDDGWEDRIRSYGLRAGVEEWDRHRPKCLRCGDRLEAPSYWADTGRPRKYCSSSCRQAAYRERRRETS